MGGCFGCLGKTIGATFVLLFAMVMPLSIWWINAQRVAFRSDTYIETFAEYDVYENLTPLVLPAVAENEQDREVKAGKLQFATIIENLDSDDWKAIASEVVPADYLQQQVEINMQRMFDYMNGDSAILAVEFDTSLLRNNMLGQPGDRMINRIFQSWDDCTPEDEAQMVSFLAEEAVDFPYCKPEDSNLQREVFTLLNSAKDEWVSDTPEIWNMREQYAIRNDTTLVAADENFYTNIQRPAVLWRELVPLAILLPCSLLALIVIFAVDSAKSFFRWMGCPLILTGLAVLLPLLFLPLFHGVQFNDPTTEPKVDAIQAEALRGVFISLTEAFTEPSLIQGTIIVGLGFFLLLISTFIPSNQPPYAYAYEMSGSTPVLPMEPEGSSGTVRLANSKSTQPTTPPSQMSRSSQRRASRAERSQSKSQSKSKKSSPNTSELSSRHYKVPLDIKDEDEDDEDDE